MIRRNLLSAILLYAMIGGTVFVTQHKMTNKLCVLGNLFDVAQCSDGSLTWKEIKNGIVWPLWALS